MKCFHIGQGIIVPGFHVDHKLTRPSVVYDGRDMRLSNDYLTSGSQLARVMEADVSVDENRVFTLKPETEETSTQALVILNTSQSTGALNVALNGMLGSEQMLYNKNRVQAAVKLQGEMVRFNTSTVVARLFPGQTLTVHATFTKRVKLPFTWSLTEWINRWRFGPQYEYTNLLLESYSFDGVTVKSEFEELGKKVVSMVFGE